MKRSCNALRLHPDINLPGLLRRGLPVVLVCKMNERMLHIDHFDPRKVGKHEVARHFVLQIAFCKRFPSHPRFPEIILDISHRQILAINGLATLCSNNFFTVIL